MKYLVPAPQRSAWSAWPRALWRTALTIPLIIQTIRRDPSGSVWIDQASNLSRPDPSGADQSDAEHQATELAAGVVESADRTSLEAVLKAPGDDPARTDPDDRVVEPLHDGLTSSVDRARHAAHLHGTGLPGREHIVDDQRRHAVRLTSRNFLRVAKSWPPMSMASGGEHDQTDVEP